MLQASLRGSIACAAGLAIATTLCAATAPFILGDSGGQWKSAQVQEFLPHDLTLEEVFQHVGKPDRFVVLSAPKPSSAPDSLADFARRLRLDFAGEHPGTATEARKSLFGFEGCDLQFTTTVEEKKFVCELFAFEDGGFHWAILYVTDAAVPAAAPFNLLQKRPIPPDNTLMLAPLRVGAGAITSFPIAFRFVGEPATGLVRSLVVTGLPEDTSQANTAIDIGDEIVAIDGRPSRTFAASAGRDTDLGRVFSNRHRGDKVTLELVSARTHEHYSVTLQAGLALTPRSVLGRNFHSAR